MDSKKSVGKLPEEKFSLTQNSALSCSECIDISFNNLTYSVPVSFFSRDRKSILKGIDGEYKSGELTAIMGPSGSGKTSLLNVLSGFIKEGVGGKMYANGVEMDTKRAHTKSLSAYIMQEDHLNPDFTVQEIMLHAAHMKLSAGHNYKTKNQLIDKILSSMSMSGTKKTRCNRLSGGEKKRLNVCLELIDNPPILFLDEPTSGLDSSNCSLLVNELKELAKSNRTVICTIHQPSAAIFSLFDHLYLIDSGKTVYQGDADKLLPFLEHIGFPCPLFHNPADFVMDLVVGEFGCFTDNLIEASKSDKWRDIKSIEYNKISANQVKRGADKSKDGWVERTGRTNQPPSEWTRYVYLVEIIIKQLNRDWVLTRLKLLMHIMSALSIGILFFKFGDDATKVLSNTIYLFITSVYITNTTVIPAVIKFPPMLNIIKKEHFNNWYKFKTYFFAFCSVNIPMQLLFCLIFLIISYVLTGQPPELFRFGLLALSTALESIISDMLGLMMGTVEVPVNGVFIASIYLTVTFLLGGYFAPIKNLLGFLHFLSYFSFLRYSYELKLIAIYGLGRGKFICPEKEFYCHVRYPKIVFDLIGLEADQMTRDLIVLVIFTVVFAIMAYIRLRITIKKI